MPQEPIHVNHPDVRENLTVRALRPGLFTMSSTLMLHQRLDQAILAAQPVGTIPVRRITLPASTLSSSILSSALFNTLTQLQPTNNGVPRDQIQVPISPVPEVTDQVLFESAADPT